MTKPARRGPHPALWAAGAVLLILASLAAAFYLGRAPAAAEDLTLAAVPTGTLQAPASDSITELHDPGPLSTATFPVPAWPTIAECPSGVLETVKGGYARLPEEASDVEVNVVKALDIELGHDATPEVVAILQCSRPERVAQQVVAYERTAGGLRVLGPVVASGPDIAAIHDVTAEPDGHVRLQVWDRDRSHALSAVTQWRGYRWVEGHFIQTEGPTSFPTNPSSVELAIDGDVTIGDTVTAGWVVTVAVTVSNTGSLTPSGLLLTLELPSQLQPAGNAWSGCILDQSNVAENGELVLQCPLDSLSPNESRDLAYQFVVAANATKPTWPVVAMSVTQTAPAALQRDWASNEVGIAMPVLPAPNS